MNNKNKYILLTLALVSFILAAVVGRSMHTDWGNEELWGSKPLWFWLFVWAGILLSLGHRISKLPNKIKLLGASVLSGVLFAGGFMPMLTFFLMFVAFVPLLWAEHQVFLAKKSTSKWTVFKLAFVSFFTWNLLSTWWIQNSSFAAGIFGNTLNAIFMCIPFVFYHITKKRMGLRAANWGLASYWLTFEIGHLHWDLSWPWLTLGNSFAHLPWLVQWYEYTGVFGGSIWILGFNIFIANQVNLAYEKSDFSILKSKHTISNIAGMFLLPILLSLGLYYTHNIETERAVEVVAIQPNYEPHYQKFRVPNDSQIKQFKQLSKGAISEKTAYLVFPETSFGGIEVEMLERHSTIDTFRNLIAKYPKLNLVMGLGSYKEYKEDEPKPPNIFTYCNPDKTFCRYIDSHNSAIQLNNEQTKIPYYKKSKLVPGAESMPFIGSFSFAKNFVLDMGGVPGLGLGTQKERAVFESTTGVVAPLICYESIYGDYVTEYTRKGAEALFVITNDGWWDNSWGHRQHLYLSSLRAIENRRAVVRAANTGISAFIDSRGDIYKQSKYGEAVALKGTIYLHEKKTFYTLYGDLIGRVSILVTVWLLITMIANGLKRENN